MLYAALYVRPGQKPFPKSIVEEPALRKYWEAFGERPGDLALIAQLEDRSIGVIWARQFTAQKPGYGFVRGDIPEISMAIHPDFRSQGIGNQLLEGIINLAKKRGCRGLSLSVDKENWANSWYRKQGFQAYEEVGTAYTLLQLWNGK